MSDKTLQRLHACADDPMWADHAEVPKALLRDAIAMLAARPAAPQAMDERAAFEADMRKRGIDIERVNDGWTNPYKHSHVESLWAGWKARASLSQAAPAQPVTEQLYDLEGVALKSQEPFHFVCCDCGLTHRVVIVSEDGKDVGFAVERDEQATADRRAQAQPEGLSEFLADLDRSRGKYPNNARMFDGLMGEVDELRRAYAGDGDIIAEAFDVAVCAFRIATEGDDGGNTRLVVEQEQPAQQPDKDGA